MAYRPIVAVCGGTGSQGGSVVQFLVTNGCFEPRVVTRNHLRPSAKRLEAQGIKVVQADYDDYESLLKAFGGCYGVFAVTDWFDAGDRELQQGRNLINAAKENQVRHFIWSALEHVPDMNIPYFELKAQINDYLLSSGVPYTSLYPTFYFSNLFIMGFSKRKDGSWDLNIPYPSDSTIPSLAVSDIGGWALAALLHPEEWLGKEMKVCSEHITPRQYATTFAELSGLEVHLQEVTIDQFLAIKPDEYYFGSGVWYNMKWFLDEGTRCRDAELAKRLHPNLQSWRDFISQNRYLPPSQPLSIQMMIEVEVE